MDDLTLLMAELLAQLNAVLDATGKPTVTMVKPLAYAFYNLPGNEVGGSCHIVLEDFNVDDSSVDYCVDSAREKGDVIGEKMALVLRRCSRTQRLKVARTFGDLEE